jgi:cell wall-associated protease
MMKRLTCLLILNVACLFLTLYCSAQELPKDWHHKDLVKDGWFGVSSNELYSGFLKQSLIQKKRKKTVLIAVIDSGIDTTHEDLKFNIAPGGWSFLGNATGVNVKYENLELVRVLRPLREKFLYTNISDTVGKARYEELSRVYEAEYEQNKTVYDNIDGFRKVLDSIVLAIGKPAPTLTDFSTFKPVSNPQKAVSQNMIRQLQHDPNGFNAFYADRIKGPLHHFEEVLNYHLNFNYTTDSLRGSGNADVMGPDPEHGSHVAGIIGAVRDNHLGIDGIADQVKLLSIRTVPNGDERDEDVAAAIRYAVDHGAMIINMSFGKAYATNKEAVDKAIRYALRKGCLLVQAAGNAGQNIDSVASFPMRGIPYRDSHKGAWIVVGASGPKDDATLAAGFSNYGKQSVDIFAPGVDIYSTVPGSKYSRHNGTSMAAPVVAGVAALIWEYFPKLSAKKIKALLMATATKRSILSDKCISGGVVNVHQAFQELIK